MHLHYVQCTSHSNNTQSIIYHTELVLQNDTEEMEVERKGHQLDVDFVYVKNGDRMQKKSKSKIAMFSGVPLLISWRQMWNLDTQQWDRVEVTSTPSITRLCKHTLEQYQSEGDLVGVERCKAFLWALKFTPHRVVDVTEEQLSKSQKRRRKRRAAKQRKEDQEQALMTVEQMLTDFKEDERTQKPVGRKTKP